MDKSCFLPISRPRGGGNISAVYVYTLYRTNLQSSNHGEINRARNVFPKCRTCYLASLSSTYPRGRQSIQTFIILKSYIKVRIHDILRDMLR